VGPSPSSTQQITQDTQEASLHLYQAQQNTRQGGQGLHGSSIVYQNFISQVHEGRTRREEVDMEELCEQMQLMRLAEEQWLEEQSNPGDFLWGDRLMGKEEGVLRVGLMNINGFPLAARGRKLADLKGFLLAYQFDVMGFTEVNVHWNSVDNANRLDSLTKGWFAGGLKRSTAFFVRHPFPVPHIFGGVSQWTMDRAIPRVVETGVDASGLGRWAWQRYAGREGIRLRIVTAYRPVPGRGPRSVWMQQKNFLMAKGDEREPRQVWLQDLMALIHQWLQEGDQLMINMDANDDVTKGPIARAMREAGLVDVISHRHGTGPATFQRGVVPIDGMFVTPSLGGCVCGYVEGVSDHAVVWVDIPYPVAFGLDYEIGTKPPPRRLKCSDPRVVRRYVQILEKECDVMHLCERAEALFTAVVEEGVQWGSDCEQEWEAIDRKLTAAMNKAENGCRRFRCGPIAWTPFYSQLRACEKAWVLKLCGRTRAGRTGYFQRVCRKAGIYIDRRVSKDEARVELALVRKALKEYQADHEAQRQNWLEAMAEAHAERDWERKGGRALVDCTEEEAFEVSQMAASWYQRLLKVEEQRRAAFVVRVATGRLQQRQGITAIIAPDGSGGRAKLDQRSAMEAALLEEAARRCNQAALSPFMQEPMATVVGPTAGSKGAERMLAGQFSPLPMVDAFANSMVGQFHVPGVRPMPMKWDLERYTRAWQRVREQTSSSPFSPHIGHYKAALESKTLHLLHSRMAWLPFVTGFAPQRWKNMVGVMIYKKPGNINLEMMRQIHLFAADANVNNKILGREMMVHAEEAGLVAPEQYGSRKRHSAVAHALNKQVAYSMVRVLRAPAAMCSNDAQGCYDRIVHAVASLSMQRVGVPLEPIMSMFTTLQQMQQFVRTAYGDSPVSLSVADVNPVAIQGVGQGNGAAPQIWALVSTVLLNMLREAGFGARFVSPLSHESVFYAAFSFVDDTDILVTDAERLRSSGAVAHEMQQALRQWEGALRASGGALEPRKSHWYLIDFEAKHGVWRYRSLAQTQTEVEIRDPHGVLTALEQVDPSEARRTLGVFLAPDGSAEGQFKVLMEKATAWADSIRSNHISRRYAWQAFSTVVVPQLAYPLPVTTMSRKQCETIDWVLRRAVLPHAGVVRTFPVELAYGSVGMQGLGMLRMYDRQGLAALSALVTSLLSPTDLLRQQLLVLLQMQQVEAGVPYQLLEAERRVYLPLVTTTWLTSLWQYLDETGIKVTGGRALQIRRVGDCFLMPALAREFRGKELARLNNCRLWLQVLRLSDLVTTDGTQFTSAAWEGARSLVDPWWPARPAPTASDWKRWREALRQCFGGVGRSAGAQERKLRCPLGAWFTDELFPWEYHPASHTLFERSEQVRRYCVSNDRRTRQRVGTFVLQEEGGVLLPGTIPASVSPVAPGVWRLDGVSARTKGPSMMGEPEWFTRMEVSLPDDDGAEFAEAMRTGQAVAVADGSFKDERGTAAVILEGGNSRITLLAMVPGLRSQQSALRSELLGLLALVRWVEDFAQEWDIDSGAVAAACDNRVAVAAAANFRLPVVLRSAHFDVVSALRDAIRRSPVKWSFQHVKGHTVGPQRTRWERLNGVADEACKQFWHQQASVDGLLDQTVAGDEWAVWLGERKVCSSLVATITQWVQCRSASQYWDGRMGSNAAGQVDWALTGQVMRSLPQSRQVWLAKQSSGMCATGTRMFSQGQRERPMCPRCPLDEDSEHILCCRGIGTLERWVGHMQSLRGWMESEDTDPEIVLALLGGLAQWRALLPGERKLHALLRKGNLMPGSADQRRYVRQQHLIGWRAVLEGRLATGWGWAQERYWLRHGRVKNVYRWATALVHRLLLISWDFWDHRNQILHGTEMSLAVQSVDLRIRALYLAGPQSVPTYCRGLFRLSLFSLLRRPLSYKMDWLTSVETGRAARWRLSPH
jgi:hypothetical protein